MTYKTILAPMIIEETARIVAEAALMVAGQASGHVIGTHVRQASYYYPATIDGAGAGIPSSTIVESLENAAMEQAMSQRALFEEVCNAAGAHKVPLKEASTKTGVTASWRDSRGVIPLDVSRAARVTDISVAAMPGKHAHGLGLDIIESLLMASGKPVLLIPHNGMSSIPQRVLVGWDGSRASARAVESALPLLHSAKEVRLVMVKQGDLDVPSADAAANYLRMHGIDVSVDIVARSKGGIAKQLLAYAESANSDLMVLGGYSHSRFEEALFGGVTRHILDYADLTVLMAH